MRRIFPFRSRLLALAASVFLALNGLAAETAPPAPPPPAFDIPRLDGITVDGNPADWQDRGFSIAVLSELTGRRKPETDADASLRLAWDARGLLVLLHVTDNVFAEAGKDSSLWEGDSAELFLAAAPGAKDVIQVLVSPGFDPKHPALRTSMVDRRTPELKTKTRPAPAVTAAVTRNPSGDGYWLELLAPWDNLGITPKAGAGLGFQVYVSDSDGGSRSKLAWFPADGASSDSKKLYALRLAATPSPAVTAAATARYENFRRIRVDVAATADQAGKIVELRPFSDGISTLVPLKPDGRLATASLILPMPLPGKTAPLLDLRLDGKTLAMPSLEDPEKARQDAFADAELRFTSFVFTGEDFPRAEFANPSLVEDLIGLYELKTTFFDAGFNPVTQAAAPGRYGAVVEIRPETGPVTRRYVTLFRQPAEVKWWTAKVRATLELPAGFGPAPAVLAEQKHAVDYFVRNLFRDACRRNADSAVFLAGLYETKPGAGDLPERLGPWGLDGRWWYDIKKKLGLLEPYKYLARVPEGQPPAGGKWPVILFLHGSGERGTDLPKVSSHGPLKVAKAGKIDLPFILVAPQCPARIWWNPWQLLDLLDEVAAKYPVDPDRIYLTGLSMGGFGSWSLACLAPERFAAVAPICGGGDPADAARLKELPVWVVHGGQDPTVPPELSADMVEALRALPGRVRFTVYPEAGHDSWSAFYASPEFYRWLLRQRRGTPDQAPAAIQGRAPEPD